ncbi:hypothetical protein X747_31885 [Mesorhizobium sp. LNJC384A00]|nr:hypothetical protein X747_31885 [Mesorhizobium sp. LNJC384A00]
MKLPRATRRVVAINGKKQWLWRAVDQDGFVLEVLGQSRRNAKAKRLMHTLLKAKGQTPGFMISDKLRYYDAARRDLMPGIEHWSLSSAQLRYLRNAAMQNWNKIACVAVA